MTDSANVVARLRGSADGKHRASRYGARQADLGKLLGEAPDREAAHFADGIE
jgi:hypothetical protein